MIRVLFVCHGNICRSTMAQFVLQDMVNKRGLAQEFFIDSAATSTEEIGNDVHRGTRRELESRGVPCGHHRARQMKREDGELWDYLIGMDKANIRNMHRIVGSKAQSRCYKLLEFAGSTADVADPWYTGDFVTTYRDIELGCRSFLASLGFSVSRETEMTELQ